MYYVVIESALPSHVSVNAKISMSRDITMSATESALFLMERTFRHCTSSCTLRVWLIRAGSKKQFVEDDV